KLVTVRTNPAPLMLLNENKPPRPELVCTESPSDTSLMEAPTMGAPCASLNVPCTRLLVCEKPGDKREKNSAANKATRITACLVFDGLKLTIRIVRKI